MNPADEAELAVLGSVVLTSGDALDDMTITGVDFRDPKRGDLFDLMRRLHTEGKPVDVVALADANPEETAFLWTLSDHVTTPKAGGYYADIVAKHSMHRRLKNVGYALANLELSDTSVLVEAARKMIDEAVGAQDARVQYVRDILPHLVERLSAEKVFHPSPWPSLNDKIGGFRPGAVYVIAARPGQGKTVVAGQIAVALAGHGHVAFSSLEMTGDELVARMVSERLGIGVGRVKDAQLNPDDWDRLAKGREVLERLQIAIDDRSGIAASDVRAFAHSVSRKGVLAGVVVDYMQLMQSRSKMDRHLQVAEFSRQLKIMAKDFQVPVIALSQLNRNSEASALAVPKLGDLRESGAIEQDADVVMLLRRDGEYPSESLIVDVAKNRHGPTGDVRLHWDGPFSRVMEW